MLVDNFRILVLYVGLHNLKPKGILMVATKDLLHDLNVPQIFDLLHLSDILQFFSDAAPLFQVFYWVGTLAIEHIAKVRNRHHADRPPVVPWAEKKRGRVILI